MMKTTVFVSPRRNFYFIDYPVELTENVEFIRNGLRHVKERLFTAISRLIQAEPDFIEFVKPSNTANQEMWLYYSWWKEIENVQWSAELQNEAQNAYEYAVREGKVEVEIYDDKIVFSVHAYDDMDISYDENKVFVSSRVIDKLAMRLDLVEA